MQFKSRLLAGAPGAAGATIALTFFMAAMIAAPEIVVAETGPKVSIDIKPEVIEVPPKTIRPETEYRKVEVPPAPPQIERTGPTQPKEEWREIKPVKVEIDEGLIHSGDRPAIVVVSATIKVPPVYPPRMAEKGIEGECTVTYDVSPEGRTFNIRPTCSHSGFEAASVKATSGFKYQPPTKDGFPTTLYGHVTTFTYDFSD